MTDNTTDPNHENQDTFVLQTTEEPLTEIQEPTETPEEPKKKLNLQPKYLLIGLAVVIVVLALASFLPRLVSKQQSNLPLEVTPTPEITPIIEKPSNYATDSAVLSIESELEIIEKDLRETKFSNEDLIPPQIDLEVKFDLVD